jgi:hypothetical protein
LAVVVPEAAVPAMFPPGSAGRGVGTLRTIPLDAIPDDTAGGSLT